MTTRPGRSSMRIGRPGPLVASVRNGVCDRLAYHDVRQLREFKPSSSCDNEIRPEFVNNELRDFSHLVLYRTAEFAPQIVIDAFVRVAEHFYERLPEMFGWIRKQYKSAGNRKDCVTIFV
jgi:hypothetical protein